MTFITSSHTVSRPPPQTHPPRSQSHGAPGLGTVPTTAKVPEGKKSKAQRPPG